jgi:hypothetical protein
MDVVDRIIGAFPTFLTTESAALADLLTSEGAAFSPHSFSVLVGGETITIPERLYVERQVPAGLDDLGRCLLTRHHSGFVRQRALERVLSLNEPWTAPFIVRLVGEYVIEIIEQIDEAFALISDENMGTFVVSNPDFMRLTRARVTSYWNCYFRSTPRRDHVGFRLIDRIEATGL